MNTLFEVVVDPIIIVDMKLVIFSPLFVVGFKELRNFIKIKSLFDILSRREMQWGSLKRIGTEKKTA